MSKPDCFTNGCSKVALKFVVDAVAICAIEQSLLASLEELFSPTAMMAMDDELVRTISAEPPQNERMREQTTQKLRVLRNGLATVQTHALRKREGRLKHSWANLSDLSLAAEPGVRGSQDSPCRRSTLSSSKDCDASDPVPPAAPEYPAVEAQEESVLDMV